MIGEPDSISRLSSVGTREEQLIAVRIIHLERLVAPARFSGGNGALYELTAKICESLRSQLNKQASSISTRCVFTEDDLALSMIDLANLSCTVRFMPTLFEAEHLHVEASRAIHVGDEEDWACVPSVNNLASRSVLCHRPLLIRFSEG
jgi:hypothetical protein